MVESVHRLLLALVDWSYIEQLNTLEQAQVVDASKPQTERYRLTEEALIALSGIRRSQSANGVEVDSNRQEEQLHNSLPENLGRVSVGEQSEAIKSSHFLAWGASARCTEPSILVVSGRSH